MRTASRTATLLAGLAAASLVACGGEDDGRLTCTGSGDPDALRGSYCEGSEITWDTVTVGWFEAAQTIRIRYGIQEPDRVSPRFEIQVLGERVSLTAGTQIGLRDAGFVRRWPEGGRDPQNLTERLEPSSNLVFETLELRVGGVASGTFDLLLDSGRTLRGQFSGALEDLSAPGGD